MLRRTFLAAAAVSPLLGAETERVLDTHLHLRADPESCFAHMQGCGVTHAVLLTHASDEEKAKSAVARHPGLFARSVEVDPAAPGAEQVLRKAIAGGAISIGEVKYKLAVDSPEMRRVYDIAAELNEIYRGHGLLGYRSFGYGHSFGVLSHYYGREAGVELREDINTVLQPGMVVSMEPMLSIPEGLPGAGGYREHDILVLTETGAQNITGFPFGPEHNIVAG